MTRQPFADLSIGAFVERVASSEPVPGGGSVSAIAASFAAGLVAMVAGLSQGRPKYAAYEATHARALEAGRRAAARFLALADEDAEAYAAFSAALKLPRETAEEQATRHEAMRAAARRAAETPLEVLRACDDLAAEVQAMAGRSNLNASSDINVASLLVEAAARGAAANVVVNLPSVDDERYAGRVTDEVMALLRSIEDRAAVAREHAGSGHLRPPEDA